jgi:putative Holliday junction resolvase
MTRLLGVDLGTERIGLALGDTVTGKVVPLTTFRRSDLGRDARSVAKFAVEQRIDELVVGLPLNMDGSEGSIARAARKFGVQLGSYLSLPVEYADERLTSVEARERLSAQGGLRGKKDAIDALAAAIILEDWLTANRNPS